MDLDFPDQLSAGAVLHHGAFVHDLGSHHQITRLVAHQKHFSEAAFAHDVSELVVFFFEVADELLLGVQVRLGGDCGPFLARQWPASSMMVLLVWVRLWTPLIFLADR